MRMRSRLASPTASSRASRAGLAAAPESRAGPAPDPGPGRLVRADRRRAAPGRDRGGGDREGEGAAGGRPGGDLGGAVGARRPARPALAAHLAERAAEPASPPED